MDKKNIPPRQFELSNLTNSSKSNVLDKTLSEGFAPIKNSTEHIDTVSEWPKTENFTDKIAKIRAARQLGGKVLSALPFAGVGYAALQGDPAMAASEAMGDVPVLGQAYEAIKSDDVGESADAERMMLNNHNARVDYDKSPAHLARLNALRMMGK